REIGGDRFISYDFKKQDGFLKANRRAAELGLYRQIYCGCEYSIRHKEPYRIAILGMGYRGRVYAQWALEHPQDLQVIAIAEPDEAIRQTWAAKLGIAPACAVADWQAALQVEGIEAAVIALPDRLHTPAAMQALSQRLHLLLEKPVGATWDECVALDAAVRQAKCFVQVGHILRFTPYYRKIAALIHGGSLGEVVSIRHLEPVGYRKAAHAFCRGPFGNTDMASPMILQKCSHDFDLFAWWIGKHCCSVQSFGDLFQFRPEHAPKGAATKCLQCPAAIERTCPYSAIRLLRESAELHYALPDTTPEGIERALEGNQGRCVYVCGSDAVDHQTVNLLFENGVTVQHCMESHTWGRDRETRIFLTRGEIWGDARKILVRRFSDRKTFEWDAALETGNATHESSYVLGNDGLMRDWVDSMRTLSPDLYADRFHTSIQAHAMAFAAECSRTSGGHPVPLATL
ncbi:MAG: epoxyqueuosine reductase QueH, partial [Kiritimatiellae bacterium]|nr:epoxyqueuosine reductase QueH [Kiritimatiellia bacterium]